MRAIIIMVVVLIYGLFTLAEADCRLYYTSQKRVENLKSQNQDIAELSSAVNKVLKTSYEILNKVDHATLGLASAIVTRGKASFEDVKPSEWDKLSLVGTVIYQDSAFSGVPLKGSKLTFSESQNSRTITTGAYGEFSEYFHKIVPYSRLRLFPFPIWEVGTRSEPSFKIPIKVKLESKICTAETTIPDVPVGQLVLVAMPDQPKSL